MNEVCGIDRESVRSDGYALIVAIEKVEGVGGEVEAIAVSEVDFAGNTQIGRGVVGSGESVAAVAREAVVKVIAVLVGIAGDGGVDGSSTADVRDAGNLPVVEKLTEKFVSPVEGSRFGGECRYQTVALVGDAGAPFADGVEGILHGGWRAGDERVLAIVNGVSVG